MGHGIFYISTKIIVDVDGSLSKVCRRQQFCVKHMSTSTGCCRRSFDVDKVSTSSCRRHPGFKKVSTAICRCRQKPSNVDMSSPRTCRRPSTPTCRRRQGFDKKTCSLRRSRKLFSKPSNSAYKICRINNFLNHHQKFNSAYAELYY